MKRKTHPEGENLQSSVLPSIRLRTRDLSWHFHLNFLD